MVMETVRTERRVTAGTRLSLMSAAERMRVTAVAWMCRRKGAGRVFKCIPQVKVLMGQHANKTPALKNIVSLICICVNDSKLEHWWATS